jgi:hypothetical protein
MVDPTYYAAFAWALLDAIADTSAVPPKLRPHREMRCITKVQNEAVRGEYCSLFYPCPRHLTNLFSGHPLHVV